MKPHGYLWLAAAILAVLDLIGWIGIGAEVGLLVAAVGELVVEG